MPYNAELLENLLGNYEIWMNCFMNIVPLLSETQISNDNESIYEDSNHSSPAQIDKEEFHHSNGQYFSEC